MPALRNKQHETFCQEYIVDLNQRAAAVRAGYKQSNARSQGAKLRQRPDVAARINELVASRSKRTGVTADQVLEEMTILAHSNITDYELDKNGKLKVCEGVDPIALRAVAAVKYRTRKFKDGSVLHEAEIKLWNKPDVIRLEGLHLKLFSEKHEHKHTGEVRFVPPAIAHPEKSSDNG